MPPSVYLRNGMLKKILFVLALLTSSVVIADCPQFYPNGIPMKPKGSTELCNSFFVTLYDEKNNRALFSSELLQPSGHNLPRKNSFHADKRVKNPIRPTDYLKTKKDRGHLVPSDDATTEKEMFDTYNMTNMTPQDPVLNRGQWKKLEGTTRRFAGAGGVPINVVTGAIYESKELMSDLVPIPTAYYKILYLANKPAKAFYAENSSDASVQTINIEKINIKTGYNFPK